MVIIGLNPSHHSSVCLLENGELKFFIQEERVGNREKYKKPPFLSFFNLLQSFSPDWVTWGSPSMIFPVSSVESNIPYWAAISQIFNSKVIYQDFSPNNHHLCHVSHAFYNSGFKECIGIVIDGLGSLTSNSFQETETIYKCSYPNNFKVIYKNTRKDNVNLSRVYETITMHLGWSREEAGKTMGLAPYGNFNPNLPNFFISNKGNPKVFYEDFDSSNSQETYIDISNNPQLKLSMDPKEWHYNKSKITDLEKDLAWKVQNDTQQLVGDYIEKAIQEIGLKQVCCAGGYFLNCVTNYYLTKRFPDVKFYFEPIANDSGTAIGAAKLVWHHETKDTTIRPLKSLYLGKQYSKEELLEGISKYVDTPQ